VSRGEEHDGSRKHGRLSSRTSGALHGPALPHPAEPLDVACTRLPDGTTVAAVGLGDVGKDGAVQVWDLASGQEHHLLTFPDPVVGLTFTAEHRLVVATGLDVAAYDLPVLL
jgi:hypothetical protein